MFGGESYPLFDHINRVSIHMLAPKTTRIFDEETKSAHSKQSRRRVNRRTGTSAEHVTCFAVCSISSPLFHVLTARTHLPLHEKDTGSVQSSRDATERVRTRSSSRKRTGATAVEVIASRFKSERGPLSMHVQSVARRNQRSEECWQRNDKERERVRGCNISAFDKYFRLLAWRTISRRRRRLGQEKGRNT